MSWRGRGHGGAGLRRGKAAIGSGGTATGPNPFPRGFTRFGMSEQWDKSLQALLDTRSHAPTDPALT